MANRQEFTRGVRNEIGERARNAIGQPICEWCLAITYTRELHHLHQDAMKRPEDKRKPLTAKDGVLICLPCHDKASASQAKEFNKAERVRANHNGVGLPPSNPLQSRNSFPGGSPKRRATTRPTKIASGLPGLARQYGLDPPQLAAPMAEAAE